MTNAEGTTKHKVQTAAAEDAFWGSADTLVVREDPPAPRVYDLEERTARFGEAVIDFAKTIPHNSVTSRIISQLVGAATSVGRTTSKPMVQFRKKNF